MTDISIEVNGKGFRGWEEVQIQTSLESLSGAFSLVTSNIPQWPIREGDACIVKVENTTLVSGYVDEANAELSESGIAMQLAGRDAAADLVDSSLLLDKWEFRKLGVLELAKKICEPFGIAVAVQSGLVLDSDGRIDKFSIDPGATAHHALEELCRRVGVFAVSDGTGNILLTRASKARCASDIVYGVNLKRLYAKADGKERFGRYVVMGGTAGSKKNHGAALKSRGEAVDSSVRDVRVTVIRPEANSNTAQAKTRAQWEATVRAARSQTIGVTVSGWLQSDKTPWQVNKLVRVKCDPLGINGDFLITDASLSLSVSNGETTEMTLKRSDAFEPQPTVKKISTNGKSGTWAELKRGVP